MRLTSTAAVSTEIPPTNARATPAVEALPAADENEDCADSVDERQDEERCAENDQHDLEHPAGRRPAARLRGPFDGSVGTLAFLARLVGPLRAAERTYGSRMSTHETFDGHSARGFVSAKRCA